MSLSKNVLLNWYTTMIFFWEIKALFDTQKFNSFLWVCCFHTLSWITRRTQKYNECKLQSHLWIVNKNRVEQLICTKVWKMNEEHGKLETNLKLRKEKVAAIEQCRQEFSRAIGHFVKVFRHSKLNKRKLLGGL